MTSLHPRPSTARVPTSPALSIFSVVSSSSTSTSSSSTSLPGMRGNMLIKELGIDKLVVPKARRPKFDLDLQIHDLTNVPIVSGQAFVKWNVEGVTRNVGRGQTERDPIKDHKVVWNFSTVVQDIRMTIGRHNMLQSQNITLNVFHEYPKTKEKDLLGTVALNLAEYAGLEGVTRRYLMQNSKINSTIRVTISMRQTGGDGYYETPPLRGQQVFSGIANLIGSDTHSHRENSDDGSRSHALPSLSISTQAGAAQDTYRLNLAASWQLQEGELNAEDCIEDIFAGGDGWSGREKKSAKSVRLFDPSGKGSDSDSTSQRSKNSAASTLEVPPMTVGKNKDRPIALATQTTKQAPPKLQLLMARTRNGGRRQKEVDELELRDDFVSWSLSQGL
ncbi:hypothetical protein EX30DRAFT_373246 [Ascodesmis nigricans]|uniref:C2 NT-type domain-containing protein n=1 Tax=Ascodesmis nigricans TaxID=341454 RepID=A0A4S2MPK8_9PEZI|nr:hypothetical protein EX30DRAFT_373246 [Ascodesmis nigricans]